MNPPGAHTAVFALLGEPVAHSASPAMMNAAFAAVELDAVYVALCCGGRDLQGLIEGMARSGGGGNVTVPHKTRAASFVEVPSAAVEATGACNTFWMRDGRIHGDNTDVEGFRLATEELMREPIEGATVLLLGAGGGARAVMEAVVSGGAARVIVLNRDLARARTLVDELGRGVARVLEPDEELGDTHIDLIVNATPVGIGAGDPLPIQRRVLEGAGAVHDLVYRRGGTRLVQEARRFGIPATDGAGMLLEQAARAFECWWGRPAPKDEMGRALWTALDRRAE